jgi:hypothetical protein
MQALSAMDARWGSSMMLTIVHASRINASSLSRVLDFLDHESLPHGECVWVDAGVMTPMQRKVFARFISASQPPSAELILDRLNCRAHGGSKRFSGCCNPVD